MTGAFVAIFAACAWGLAHVPIGASGTRRLRSGAPARARIDVGTLALDFSERLRAGAPLETAWQHVARTHQLAERFDPELGPPRLAELGPGGVTLAAAIRLALRTGAPLTDVLQACASAVAGADDAAAARTIALAGPRSSARILSALPLVGLAGAALLGVDVIARLTDGGIGTLSALVGCAAWLAGRAWTTRLIAAAARAPARSDHVTCELAAAALSAGAPIPTVLEVLSEVEDAPHLAHASRALLLGVSWEEAWGEHADGPLAQSLAVAWTSGASPVALLRRRAERLRAALDAEARSAASRLAARLVLPLGICFLPAFAFLALIPAIMSIFSTITF